MNDRASEGECDQADAEAELGAHDDLAGREAGYITGAGLRIDGGFAA